MTKDNKYTFRDPKGLLEQIDKGNRSKFIREAIESKIRTSKSTYNEEVEETRELINFYKDKIKTCNEELKKIEKDKENLQQQKNHAKNKLKYIRKENSTRRQILEKSEELEKQEYLTKTRLKIFNEIIINTLELRDKKTNTTINIEYMKIRGRYTNIKEMKLQFKEYVYGLQEYDMIQGKKIFKKDIEYLKKQLEGAIICV